MTRDARGALRALHDLGCVAATWEHPGYRELRHRGLADFTPQEGTALVNHRLTPRGVRLANDLFR